MPHLTADKTELRRWVIFALATLAALVVLLAASRAASGQQKVVKLAARGGAGATLSPQDNYLPSNVTFRTDGTAITVGITKIEFVGRAIGSSACRQGEGAEREAATTLRFRDGGQALIAATLSDDQPALRLTATCPDGELVIHVGGADRLVCSNGSGFATASLGANSGKLSACGSAIVLQRRADQHGLTIAADNMRLESTADGARVHVPIASTPGRPVRIDVSGFRGDALIAYEEALKRSGGIAQPVPVAALAEQQKAAAEAPRGAPREQPIGEWQWWTGTDRVFKPLLADPREAQVRLGLGYADPKLKFFEAGIGGDLVIAKKRWAPDKELSVSLRGLIIGRLDTCGSSFPLLNTDFFGGVATGYRRGNDSWEAYLYHESSHLGDEILQDNRRERIDYSREALRLLWSHDFGKLRVYGGPSVNMRAYPSDIRGKATLQLGAEYRWVAWNTPMYVACDLQSRQENDWAVNTTAQFGIELGDPAKVKNRPRVFIELFNGHSNMGQYFDEHEKYIMLGFGYNF